MHNITTDTSRKISFIAFACAVLVVSIHVPIAGNGGTFTERFVGHYLASIAVPMFFAFSGFMLAVRLANGGGIAQAVKKRARTVLLPYLLWCLILTLSENCLAIIANIAHGRSIMFGTETDITRIFGLNILGNPPQPLWYLRALFLYVLLGLAFYKLAKQTWMATVAIAALFLADILLVGMIPVRFTTIYYFSLAPINLVAFLTGMFFASHQICVSRKAGICMLSLGIGVILIGMYLETTRVCCLGHIRILIKWLSISMTAGGIWVISPSVELPKLLAGTSFPIYLIHGLFIRFAYVVADRVPFMVDNAIGYLIEIAGITAMSILVCHCIKRFIPSAANVLFGGR